MILLGTFAMIRVADSSENIGSKGKASQSQNQPPLVPAEKDFTSNLKWAISFYSQQYGFDATILTPLAECESTFRDICIIDTNGKLSCGMFQFQKTTMEQYCPDLKWHHSIKEDIMCAGRMIKSVSVLKANWVTCSKQIL